MSTNFDYIAPYYDRLSKMVFGKCMFRAQTIFLPHISPNAKVLVLGGGTGWLLAELLANNPSCEIWYIEVSAKMLELSVNKVNKSKQVIFINGTEDSIPHHVRYDVVITHFFLDLFRQSELEQVVPKIASTLDSKGIWLASDFIHTTWWHSALLKFMYSFFALAAGLSPKRLPDWRATMKENGFSEIKSHTFFSGFILSGVWSRLALKKN